MVTRLSDGRGQISVKGHEVTDDWERLAKGAASRAGTTFAGFVVDHTTAAAQAILKGEPAVPAALPVRMEDVAAGIAEKVELLAARQAADLAGLAAEQRDRLDRIERAGRRGRWRRR